MKFKIWVYFLFVFCFSCSAVSAQYKAAEAKFMTQNSPQLQNLVSRAANETLERFAAKGLKPESLAITLIDMRDANNLKQADFRGEQPIYPASVVKMFYLAAAHAQLEDGKLKDTPELR